MQARSFVLLLSSMLLALSGGVAPAGAQADMPREVQPTVGAPASVPPPPPGANAALDSARAVRGASLEVRVYTYGPGSAVFENFGHIALAIRDTLTGQHVAYNWGMFDFDQPNFLGRFLTGDTRYWMEGYRAEDFNALYRSDNRSIRAQTLQLSPTERGALFDYVVWNSQDANKYYRYDYYRDNCSTRIRDAIDYVLGGRLRSALSAPGVGRTWRAETERAMASDLPVYAGISLALGRNADLPLSRWDEAFLPEYLAEALETTAIPDATGRRTRLVATDSVVFASTRVPLPTEPPARTLTALLLGLTLAGLIAGLADSSRRATRGVLAVASFLWYLVGGVLGTLLLLAGTVTKHAPYMGANLTLLQVHPLLLVAAFVVPLALLRHARTRVSSGLSATIAAVAVLGVVVQLVPSLAQRHGVVLAVTVPVHLALATAVWRLRARAS